MLFAIVHNCWFNQEVRQKNNLPDVTDSQRTFEMICRFGFYYLLIKRINLGEGFILENEQFYTRLLRRETNACMLNKHNREWFERETLKIDNEDYVNASPGFLMGMLNAASTTMCLIAISGVNLPNTIIRSLRSSDDSMTVFVAETTKDLAISFKHHTVYTDYLK